MPVYFALEPSADLNMPPSVTVALNIWQFQRQQPAQCDGTDPKQPLPLTWLAASSTLLADKRAIVQSQATPGINLACNEHSIQAAPFVVRHHIHLT